MQNSREENKKLIKKYPFLLPRYSWSGEIVENYNYEYTERDDVPTGWLNIFDEFCEVFNIIYQKLSKEEKERFYFTDIKEKFGTLRIYTSCGTEEINNIISYYECLSGYTCIICGKQPKDSKGHHLIWNSKGYILPYCKKCAKNYIKEHNLKIEFAQAFQRDIHNDKSFKLRRYTKNNIESIDLNEYINKIKEELN